MPGYHNLLQKSQYLMDRLPNSLPECACSKGVRRNCQFALDCFGMEVAIRGVDYDAPQVQAHKVSQSKMLSDFSYEIYSMAFVKKLCALTGNLDTNCSYRMAGTISPEKRLAVFSLKTLKRIEG